MEQINFHNTPQGMYDALSEVFGEKEPNDPDSDTRWVSIGAGATTLTFFAPRYDDAEVAVTYPQAVSA